jgi:hydrogenase 3 maturation protease
METTPMSRPRWLTLLAQKLRRLRRPDRPPRVAILGIGHELCGDDAAGVLVARALQSLAAPGGQPLVIDAGSAPENYTGALRRFGPELVLLVDAARMGGQPGAVEWLDWQATAGLSASSHTLPVSVLASYLAAEFGCEVALLGIQPSDTSMGAPLSPQVRRAVDIVVRKLSQILELS